MLKNNPLPVLVVEGEEDRHNAMSAAAAAIAASGTVALELAIADVPHVIGYKVAPVTAALVKHFCTFSLSIFQTSCSVAKLFPNCCRKDASHQTSFYISTAFLSKTASTVTRRKALKSARGIGVGRTNPQRKSGGCYLANYRRCPKSVNIQILALILPGFPGSFYVLNAYFFSFGGRP